MKRGKYKLKKRAERQEETRLRIARATLELHETIGPSLTTISAIAERAGVGRPTVYSHFPDELSLLMACSSLEFSENPLPDPGPWGEISDPQRRLRAALAELYAYFRRRERMKVTLARGWESPEGPPQPLLGAIGLALDFQTWRTMARQQGLSDEQAIELMVGMVRCAVRR